MIEKVDHWYDGQIRRFLMQVVRAFSGFQYTTGWKDGAAPQLLQVPCRLALTDRMVGNLMKNGSENMLNVVPMIVVTHTGIAGRRADVQNLNHVDTRQVSERAIDPSTGKYTEARGLGYTVQRMMPRPFEITINVDIWTSTIDQKHQLFEQIGTIFFPDIYIQNSDNPLDWSAMTTMEWVDVQWSSRSIPVGTSDDIDVMTISFRLPFWLNPPAKVTHQKLIHQIVTNFYDGRHTDEISDERFLTRSIITPGNHSIRVQGGKIILLGSEGSEHSDDGEIFDWKQLLDTYGLMIPNQSEIHLLTKTDLDDRSRDIIGTIQYDNSNHNQLFYSIDPDTMPTNTLPPINAVIDPRENYPGQNLPAAATGQRYLLLESITGGSVAWGTMQANQNSIIEYQNGSWAQVFDGQNINNRTTQYVLSLLSGKQLRYSGSSNGPWEWAISVDGTVYGPGMWRLSL